VRPVDFPSSDPEWEMPVNRRHHDLSKVLEEVAGAAAGREEAAIGADQFVYWDPTDPRKRCAPDTFVKLGVPDWPFDVWKTWEHGVPELCCEILSPSDKEKLTLEQKLERFHAMGVAEIVAFDPDGMSGKRLRAWDLVSGDLVERVVEGEATPCLTLGLWFVVAPTTIHGQRVEALRLSEDSSGGRLVATSEERERAALAQKDAALAQKDAALAQKDAALAQKDAALEEIARLRAELAGRSGQTPRKRRR
jgi:Uma2 family endonuclease